MKTTLSSQDDDEKVSLWHVLRQTQRKTGCTDKTLEQIKQSLVPLLKESCQSSNSNKKSDNFLLKKADSVLLQLHGCVGCENYVFLPSDARMRCPECRHPRFNAQHKPNEVCITTSKIYHFFFVFANKYVSVCGLYLVCHLFAVCIFDIYYYAGMLVLPSHKPSAQTTKKQDVCASSQIWIPQAGTEP